MKNKYLEWCRWGYKDSLYVSEFKRNKKSKTYPFPHLHIKSQISCYICFNRHQGTIKVSNRADTKGAQNSELENITLETRPGTYNTDKTHINYLVCLVLKQTKLNPTQEIQIIYYTIPVNFLLTLFCPLFVHSRESQNIKKPWQCKIFEN